MRSLSLMLSLSTALLVACASNQGGPSAGPSGPGGQGRPGGPGGPGGMRGQRLPGDTLPTAAMNTTARADLRDVNGNSVGIVTLTQTAHGVLITGDLTTLPPGLHAIHIHDTGRCEPPFTSAGGHLNPGMRTHGFRSQTGPHAGDLPNFTVNASGSGHVEAYDRDLTLAAGMFGMNGASIIVHGGPDDYQSDPAGNSGPRIACGVVSR